MTTAWTKRRFWKEVAIEATPVGFTVLLDGKALLTPGKARFLAPSQALAQLAAEEWRTQDGAVRFSTMPVTRLINTAIDKLALVRSKVTADLAGYGETDLVCYRAEAPVALRQRQEKGWDPLIAWAGSRFGAHLKAVTGIMPAVQAPEAVQSLAAAVGRQDDFQLAALHEIVVLSGSLVIALAVIEAVRSPADAWALSRIDEDWQAEQWGEDESARAATDEKRASFLQAARFHALCGRETPRSIVAG